MLDHAGHHILGPEERRIKEIPLGVLACEVTKGRCSVVDHAAALNGLVEIAGGQEVGLEELQCPWESFIESLEGFYRGVAVVIWLPDCGMHCDALRKSRTTGPRTISKETRTDGSLRITSDRAHTMQNLARTISVRASLVLLV